jgi:hypothetical protein
VGYRYGQHRREQTQFRSDGASFAAVGFFLVIDLAYYWGHRWSHETVMWIGHNVHHSSEFYNFTTALRQGGFEALFAYPRNLIWAVLGFPPLYWLTWYEINVAFMFFVHTETVGKLWWPIELVFNTPSHHRVHHARNPAYIDKNYAGIFIVWDRLFGTFEAETDKCVYGLVHPLHTIDPLDVQLLHLKHVLRTAASHKTLAAKVGALVFGPAWFFDEKSGKWRVHELPSVHNARIELGVGVDAERFPLLLPYAVAQFVLFMATGTVTLSWQPEHSLHYVVACVLLTYSAIVIAGLFSTRDAHVDERRNDAPVLGAMLLWRAGGDVRQWVRRAETARWLLICVVACFVLDLSEALTKAVLAVAANSILLAFIATSVVRKGGEQQEAEKKQK